MNSNDTAGILRIALWSAEREDCPLGISLLTPFSPQVSDKFMGFLSQICHFEWNEGHGISWCLFNGPLQKSYFDRISLILYQEPMAVG